MPTKIVAFIGVKPGQDEPFIAAARACAAASRAEPGVVHYEIWREIEGARRFVFNELYVDDAAVDSHMGSGHFKAFGLAARDLATGRPEIIRTHAVDVPG